MDSEITKITFEFKNGSKKTVTGEELEKYKAVCLLQSDYLLPYGPDSVLGKLYGGIVSGYLPPFMLKEKGWEPF